jgi:manganese/zinc/iron transport system substrate-binding protein
MKPMFVRSLFAISLLVAAVISPSAPANAAQKLKIVATTTQAGDAIRVLAGDLVDLTTLMGAGVDPHLYKPTEADIAAMNNANLVIYSGMHLEGQFDEVFKALGERNIRTYALATPIEEQGFALQVAGETDVEDPHFWFDARNWQLALEGISQVLIEADPDNTQAYLDNTKQAIAQLDAFYQWTVDAMNMVPEEKRILITSHDAFQYFGASYGWRVLAVQGISTVAEASVRDVQEVANAVYEARVPVMFVESSVPRRTIEAVQEGVRAAARAANDTFEVAIAPLPLYSDAMDAPDKFGGTYIGMLGYNVIVILQAYGVEIPAWPKDILPEPPVDLLKDEE